MGIQSDKAATDIRVFTQPLCGTFIANNATERGTGQRINRTREFPFIPAAFETV